MRISTPCTTQNMYFLTGLVPPPPPADAARRHIVTASDTYKNVIMFV
jgi:hypothetical protein